VQELERPSLSAAIARQRDEYDANDGSPLRGDDLELGNLEYRRPARGSPRFREGQRPCSSVTPRRPGAEPCVGQNGIAALRRSGRGRCRPVGRGARSRPRDRRARRQAGLPHLIRRDLALEDVALGSGRPVIDIGRAEHCRPRALTRAGRDGRSGHEWRATRRGRCPKTP